MGGLRSSSAKLPQAVQMPGIATAPILFGRSSDSVQRLSDLQQANNSGLPEDPEGNLSEY